jgi:hypothetical protein
VLNANRNLRSVATLDGNEVLSHSSALEWFKRFKEEREDLQGDPRSGCPSTSRSADIVANVHEMMTRDRRLTLGRLSDELNINKETIHQILHEDLRNGSSAQSSSHTDSWMSRSKGNSHHAKTSYRLLKKTPIFMITFSLS